MDTRLEELRVQYPEAAALTELHGIGLFSALMIIAELGDVSRFRRAQQRVPTPD